MNEPSLAHNQTDPRPCALCGASTDETCSEHAYRTRGGSPTIDEIADLKLRSLKFIEVAVPEGVTVGGR